LRDRQNGTMTDRDEPATEAQFGLDVCHTTRESEISTGASADAGSGDERGNDDAASSTSPLVPSLYPEQLCAVCQASASWAHALSLMPPQEMRDAPRSLSLWALCNWTDPGWLIQVE
jgi:hypothetical protein